MKRFVLFPDSLVSSAYTIDYERLYAEGYRGIIYDIDNTLVPHDAPADGASIALMRRLKNIGFHTCVVSNNKEPRVKSFHDGSGVEFYVYKAGKPLGKGYKEAMKLMSTTPSTTISVGDQIFTDVWGARLLGIYSIMCEPVKKWTEPPQIIIKRIVEAPLMLIYKLLYRK